VYLALRDLRFARGRFALIGVVVTLITTLVVFLFGLTGGLSDAASAAVAKLPARQLVFGDSGGPPAFSSSSLSLQQQARWQSAASAQPLGAAMNRLTDTQGALAVSLFGAEPDLLPPVREGRAPTAGQLAVGVRTARERHLRLGDRVQLAGRPLTVAALVDERSYAHAPTVWTDFATWRQLTGQSRPTVLAVLGPVDARALDAATGTHTLSRADALSAIDGYSAEQGSLRMIQGFLFAVSALVVGAFFTVWTIQRGPDIAVLKAVGAATGYLVRDALGQALVLLLGGSALGAALGFAAGAAARSGGLPFTLGAGTAAVPFAAMVLLGLLGAGLAVRRITSVDPLTALGAAR
jgi:putative ABC transport system permease protein